MTPMNHRTMTHSLKAACTRGGGGRGPWADLLLLFRLNSPEHDAQQTYSLMPDLVRLATYRPVTGSRKTAGRGLPGITTAP